MKAVRVHTVGGPEVLTLESVTDPRPANGEVLVRVVAAGVNFLEVYQRKGLYQVPLPSTPGSEGAGVVEAVGPDVVGLKVGDRVVSQGFRGSYAELAVAPADRVVKVPDGISLDVAAAAMLQGLTAHYLVRSTFPLNASHSCVIHAAAGGVGLLLCQLARQLGARAIGTASTPEKRALAKEAGAQHVVPYDEVVAAAKSATGGVGVDVVYDSVGQTTFADSLSCLRPRGLMVLFGQSSGPVQPIDPQILNRAGSLFLTRPMLAHHVATPEELRMRTTELFDWIRNKVLHIRIDSRFPLVAAARAHEAIESRRTTGKILIDPANA